jgi:predicted HNH restriction endonuclease
MNSKAEKCDICDIAFTTKYNIKRHNSNIHKVSPEAEVTSRAEVSSGAEASPEAEVLFE